MGSYDYSFVPAAILLDNPGITKEEFTELLRKVPNRDNFRHNKFLRSCVNQGSVGVARLLNLQFTPEFTKTQEDNEDKGLNYLKRIVLGPPDNTVLHISAEKLSQEQVDFSVRLKFEKQWKRLFDYSIKQAEKQLSEGSTFSAMSGNTYWTTQLRIIFPSFYYPADHQNFRDMLTLSDRNIGKDNVYVSFLSDLEEKIINKYDKNYGPNLRIKILESPKESAHEEFSNSLKARTLAQIFKLNYSPEKFKSEEEMISKYPRYNPLRVFDFSQESGKLWAGYDYDEENDSLDPRVLKWYKQNGRYFLDKDHLKKTIGRNYTSLIISAEVIKKRFGEFGEGFLDYEDLRDDVRQKFFTDHPDSFSRYLRALHDLETSLNASYRGLTNSEFLRFRAFTRIDNR